MSKELELAQKVDKLTICIALLLGGLRGKISIDGKEVLMPLPDRLLDQVEKILAEGQKK